MFLGISVDAWSSIFIGVLILAGTITQGTIGFGLGTIATPIIALIRPELVPTLILLLALCISSYTLARTYRETSWRVVGISSLARIPGSLVGAWAIASLSPDGHRLCRTFCYDAIQLGMEPSPHHRQYAHRWRSLRRPGHLDLDRRPAHGADHEAL